jgi:hypothetical protein
VVIRELCQKAHEVWLEGEQQFRRHHPRYAEVCRQASALEREELDLLPFSRDTLERAEDRELYVNFRTYLVRMKVQGSQEFSRLKARVRDLEIWLRTPSSSEDS